MIPDLDGEDDNDDDDDNDTGLSNSDKMKKKKKKKLPNVNRGFSKKKKIHSLTLQQTQKALSGLRPSQPVFPASRKRFINSV